MTIPGRLIDSLRRLLKRRGLFYKDLATAWNVSVPTVKRLMTGGDISLERLTVACELVGVSFYQLVDLSRDTSDEALRFTPDQEDFFAASPEYLAYFSALRRGMTPDAIAAQYALDTHSTERYLRQLEALRLLERLPQGKIKLLARGSVMMWDNRGSIGRLYARKFVDAMVERAMAGLERSGDDSKLLLGLRRLSAAQRAEFERELGNLLDRYRRESILNAATTSSGKEFEPLSYVVILERWRDEIFEAIPRLS